MTIRLDTKKIYAAMAAKGMNGTDLAREIGVSQSIISRVLLGKCIGKNKIIPGICKVLDLNAKEIIIVED